MPPRDRRTSRPPMNTSRLFSGSADMGDSDLDYLLAGGAAETAPRARERGLPIRQLPVEVVAADHYQLRRIPHPRELLQMEVVGDPSATALIAGLRDLGQSIRDHGQIQPAIVYADTDAHDPAITHRLLHGQRRWTAAILMEIPTIWVVEVPRPNETERLQRQFDENEQRENFTDMERAWAIMALRDALTTERGDEASWGEVETRLRLSDSRRRDLLRLLRLSEEGQAVVQRQRWSEWTLRPLHMAISAGEIEADAATAILARLTAAYQEVTAPIVAAAIADWLAPAAAGDAAPLQASAAQARPPRSPASQHDLVARLRKVRQGMERVSDQVERSLDAATKHAMMQEATALMQSLERLVQTLEDLPGEDEAAEDSK